jgi:phage tail sheath protein FI
VIDHCERRGRLAVLSAPAPARETSSAACYGPWLEVDGRAVPPAGHVAGLMARTDDERGVAAAPAGRPLRGVSGLAGPAPSDPRVNAIRDLRETGRGILVWGARTMTGDPEWKYVNVRRLFLFLERSIDRGLEWTVFEANAEPLWAAVRRTIGDFLDREWRRGSFAGTTPDRAYRVRCDRSTMTEEDIEAGRLVCEIGVAPIRPAEFVVVRFCSRARPGSPPGRSGTR